MSALNLTGALITPQPPSMSRSQTRMRSAATLAVVVFFIAFATSAHAAYCKPSDSCW